MSNERENEWVLVPRQPTLQMCEAIGVKWESVPGFPVRWKLALAAAPSPPADAATLPAAKQDGDELPAWLLILIGEYGFAASAMTDVDRLHRWQELIAGIKRYAQAAAPAPVDHADGRVQCKVCEGSGLRLMPTAEMQDDEFTVADIAHYLIELAGNYQYDDGNTYTPDDKERALLADFAAGITEDEMFMGLCRAHFAPWRVDSLTAPAPGVGDAPSLDQRFAEMLIGIIADIQNELGFSDAEKECSNGSLEIVEAIRQLKRNAQQPGVGVESTLGNVYLVATGENRNGEELYTRHEGEPPRLCDFETLYTAPPAPQGDRLVQAALAWWEGKRPALFNLEDHIANPRVNCAGDRERDLATAIAAQAGEKS